jgi:hypothetical protein
MDACLNLLIEIGISIYFLRVPPYLDLAEPAKAPRKFDLQILLKEIYPALALARDFIIDAGIADKDVMFE